MSFVDEFNQRLREAEARTRNTGEYPSVSPGDWVLAILLDIMDDPVVIDEVFRHVDPDLEISREQVVGSFESLKRTLQGANTQEDS